MRFLGMVKAYSGHLEPIGSLRGESIFVTWSPKIFIEASAWRAYLYSLEYCLYVCFCLSHFNTFIIDSRYLLLK